MKVVKALKKAIKSFAIFGVAAVLLSAAFTVGAASPAMTTDFTETQYASFVALGDMDKNGTIEANDLVLMRKHFLGIDGVDAKYSDANNDKCDDIRDLIRLKKLLAANNTSAVKAGAGSNGAAALVLGSNAVYYNGDFVKGLKANTNYQLTVTYKSSDKLNVKIYGVAANTLSFTESASSDFTVANRVFTTGSALTENSGFEIELSGSGTVASVSVTEITDTWFDSENAEQGAIDIFTD